MSIGVYSFICKISFKIDDAQKISRLNAPGFNDKKCLKRKKNNQRRLRLTGQKPFDDEISFSSKSRIPIF